MILRVQDLGFRAWVIFVWGLGASSRVWGLEFRAWGFRALGGRGVQGGDRNILWCNGNGKRGRKDNGEETWLEDTGPPWFVCCCNVCKAHVLSDSTFCGDFAGMNVESCRILGFKCTSFSRMLGKASHPSPTVPAQLKITGIKDRTTPLSQHRQDRVLTFRACPGMLAGKS